MKQVHYPNKVAVPKTIKELRSFLRHEIKVIEENLNGFIDCGQYADALETKATLAAYSFLLEWTTGVYG